MRESRGISRPIQRQHNQERLSAAKLVMSFFRMQAPRFARYKLWVLQSATATVAAWYMPCHIRIAHAKPIIGSSNLDREHTMAKGVLRESLRPIMTTRSRSTHDMGNRADPDGRADSVGKPAVSIAELPGETTIRRTFWHRRSRMFFMRC